MKKVAFETIGCRLNQYDTELIAAELSNYGFSRTQFPEPADLYIINTCTVTGRADASCRNIISRATRQNNSAPVVVIGCYVDSDKEKVLSLYGVDLVVHNNEKESIVSILKRKFPSLFESAQPQEKSKGIAEFYDHNRAWIKIGDGCNQRCAYCIIPSVRGPLRNRSANEIVEEINTLAQNNYEEVVLTGIHIGQYSNGNLKSIADLLKYLLENCDIKRLRLSSIEPQEVNSDLIKTINGQKKRICRHLHIPLQSGSDRILKIMHRPYNQKEYLDIVRRVKDNIDGVVIGADIIVGFPGETDDDFEQSISVAESGWLDYLHVFSYSDRPGTDASELKDKVNPEVIKKRNATLRDISERSYRKALEKEINNVVYAISEHKSDKENRYRAITDNYLKILLPDGIGGGLEILSLKAKNVEENYLIGELF
jgi:threonylcarbamoyladenosine tRNA methylthiotransferase MtaB